MGPKRFIIAIDGPAGSGKTTVAELVAEKLRYLPVDTGAMYRAATWKVLQEGIDLSDKAKIIELVKRIKIELKAGKNIVEVFVDGEEVTSEIRSRKVTENIYIVARIPEVRKEMVKLQRTLGKKGGIVMEGRDITTAVFPDADFKFYLDASVEERTRRRCRELEGRGKKADFAKIKEAIEIRDKHDFTREVNPLKKAKDAIVIDTTNLTIEGVVNKILQEIY